MNTSRRDIAVFLAPWLVGWAALTVLPMAGSAVLSLFRVGAGPAGRSYEFVGADHYLEALGTFRGRAAGGGGATSERVSRVSTGDPRFARALLNSLYYALLAVPLGLVTSLALAVLLDHRARGMGLVRAIVYLPSLLGGVATIVIWSWLFNPSFGWINAGLRAAYAAMDPLVRCVRAGGTSDWPLPGWLYSPAGCKPAVVLMHLWTAGGSTLIFLAALRRVPGDIKAAAAVDGASRLIRFARVTVPLISPAILFNAVLGVVTAMQAFGESYLLQNRAQEDGLLFVVHYMYRVALESPYRVGYASALGWILFGVLFVMTMPLLWAGRRWVYDVLH